MATTEAQNINISISPVNMEARRNVGVKPGDTVRVWQKIQEKGKTRLQAFEGLVLAQKHGNEAGATFTVRRVSGGIGVEKIFPLYSPSIDKIDIVRRAKVRRAKLYYIREKVAKEIRRQMRNMRLMDVTTGSDIEEKEKQDTEEDKRDNKEDGTEAQEAPKKEEKQEVKPPTEEKDSDEEEKDESKKEEVDKK